MLKETIGRGDQVQRLIHLEKALQEEQLYSSDLKKKLQAANRQVTTFKAKAKDIAGEQRSGAVSLVVEESDLDRSKSTNDIEQQEEGKANKEQQKGGSPPSQYHLPRLTANKQQR